MATITEAMHNVFAKVKTEVLETRWLKGHRYSLIKSRSKQDGTNYQWADDQFKAVGPQYRSREMANVHFGEWEGK